MWGTVFRMLAKYLDGLNEKYPDCILSAYGDIGTGVTLVTRSRQSVPREARRFAC